MTKQTRGNGIFKIRGNKIYVHGTINGKFYRKSTGKKATAINKAWIKKQNPLRFLAELIGEEEADKTDLESFGTMILNTTTKNVGEKHKKAVFSVFNNYILTTFKDIPLENIKPIDIVNFIELLRDSLSGTRVKFIKNTFALIFDHAVDNDIVIKNPFNARTVKDINLSWETNTEAYTTEETAKILEHATGWLRVFLNLSLTTGMRTGETMVLKWNDFDLENGVLDLQRYLDNDRIIIERNNKTFERRGRGKNKKHFRFIPLFSSTVKLLKSYKEVRPHKEWLFVTKDNKPFVASSSIINYHLKPLLKEIGVPYKTLYATRRSYASIMNFSGEDLANIQENMGHAKGSAITEKHYITEDILTIANIKNQAEQQEKLFNAIIQKEE